MYIHTCIHMHLFTISQYSVSILYIYVCTYVCVFAILLEYSNCLFRVGLNVCVRTNIRMCGVFIVMLSLHRVYDLQFMDKLREVVAHDSEILCIDFSDPELGE